MRRNRRRSAKSSKQRRLEAESEKVKRDAMVTRTYGPSAHNSCGRKYRYDTYELALHHALRRIDNGAAQLRVYHCPYCDGWHLTSQELRDE